MSGAAVRFTILGWKPSITLRCVAWPPVCVPSVDGFWNRSGKYWAGDDTQNEIALFENRFSIAEKRHVLKTCHFAEWTDCAAQGGHGGPQGALHFLDSNWRQFDLAGQREPSIFLCRTHLFSTQWWLLSVCLSRVSPQCDFFSKF